jgi:hypothetical protein
MKPLTKKNNLNKVSPFQNGKSKYDTATGLNSSLTKKEIARGQNFMRITFEEIKRSANKEGVCPKCNKKAKRFATFYQTLNPFNVAYDGQLKDRDTILEELTAEIKAWRDEPTYHKKCE